MYIYIRFLEAFANFYLLFIIYCLDTTDEKIDVL